MQSDASKMSSDRNPIANSNNHSGYTTPLHYAAHGDNLSAVETLVEAGADPSSVAADGTTPLHSAVMTGSLEVTRYLLERAPDDLRRRDNLFDFGLVHLAALAADRRKLALLLDKGLDANDSNANGVTALHLASMTGNAELVAELVQRGATNVNCMDKIWHYAPLHLAAMMGYCMDLNEFIVEKSKPGFAWHLVEDRVHASLIVSCYETLQRRESVRVDYVSVVKTLLEAKANPNCVDFRGRVPLYFATQRETNEITKILLRWNAYADVRDDERRFPVHNVMERRDFDGLCYLLRYGADFDNVISLLPFPVPPFNWMRRGVPYFDSINRYLIRYMNKLTEIGFRRRAYRYAYIYMANYSEKVKRQIKEEAALLKQFYVEDKVSAYDVVHMSYRRRATFYRKLPADLNQKLPIFKSVIRGRCRQALDRVNMMRQIKLVWDSITGVRWPDICTEMICSYLSNADIAALIAGEMRMRGDLQRQRTCD